jgi:tight adherence protein B
MELIIGIGIFFTSVLIIQGLYFSFKTLNRPEAQKVRKRLKTLSTSGSYNEDIDIIRKMTLSQVPWFNRILLGMHHNHGLYRLLEQANSRHTLGFFILLSLLLASIGYVISSLISLYFFVKVSVSILFGIIPFFSLRIKKNRRMSKFERQLPDSLDLIARALKAGHAFSGGLRMVAEEFEDPIGTEFDKTQDEINFGVSVPDALKNLASRVDCPDLKFFVTSVILQRETGGNLAEILENISRLIRERFKLQGRIKALSAEGKLSAIILVSLPFVVGFIISFLNPEYVNTLFHDPIGRIALAGGVVLMIFGVSIMRKLINFKV